MEREQIIKALECCYTNNLSCIDCPFQATDKYLECAGLTLSALSLIKELTEDVEWSTKRILEADKKVAELTEELAEANKLLNMHRFLASDNGTTYVIPSVRSIKAEVVKQMQTEIESRCIKGGIYPAFVASTIDQIAKEMIGDKND